MVKRIPSQKSEQNPERSQECCKERRCEEHCQERCPFAGPIAKSSPRGRIRYHQKSTLVKAPSPRRRV